MEKGISVVFPAHNESKNIEGVVKEARRILQDLFMRLEIIIVNDGSSDGTGRIATRLSEGYKDVHVVHHERNRGYGAAVRLGFDKASLDLILLCDADGQFDISEIRKLLAHIENYDIIIGYRKNRRDSFYRRLLAHIWNFTIRYLFRIEFKDINCGFKLFKSHVLKRFELHSAGGVISTEILVRAKHKKARIKQVPVNHKPRIYGRPSGASPKTAVLAAYESALLFLRYVFDR